MKKKLTPVKEMARIFGISEGRVLQARMKVQIISAIMKVAEEDEWTHAEIAAKSGVPRSAVTGILSGSMSRITIDRLLRIAEAVGLSATITVKRAS